MNILARLLPYCLLMLTAAGDSPALAPTADVAVTYRVVRAIAPGGPRKMTVQQTAGAMKTRIDSYIFADGKTPYEGMIADRKSDRMQVLVYARQAVMQAPADSFAIPGVTLAPDMLFKRGADRTVAGLKCTDWGVTPPTGEPWTACVTATGAVLRTSSATREIEATSVSFAPLPASTFVPPPDLKPMILTPAGQ